MWLPAVIAAGAVAMEAPVTAWVKGRESALLAAVFVLLAAMMHQRIRQMLITTLCYGVACLALRDMLQSRGAVLPPAYDYVWVGNGRIVALLLVALLAATAGLTETLRPGTTLARRLYFGASSLYFSGLGVLNFVWHGTWQSVLLCFTGVVAFFGCLYADRIVAAAPAHYTVQRMAGRFRRIAGGSASHCRLAYSLTIKPCKKLHCGLKSPVAPLRQGLFRS